MTKASPQASRSQNPPLVRRAFEDYATGQYTKEQLLTRARTWGLTDRRGKPFTCQAVGVLLRNQLYASIVDVPMLGGIGRSILNRGQEL